MPNPKRIRKSGGRKPAVYGGRRRFEHWYADNQVYFITARCRERFGAFQSEAARGVFWDRLAFYTDQARFTPWVVSLVVNHYHILGYCKEGERLGGMMRKLHGSVAKLVNDTLPQRRRPFWEDNGHQDYFDGCIRDELQCRRAYRYTLTQCKRHGICENWREYPDTRVWVEVDAGVRRAHELGAFLEGVPYKRYQRRG